MKSFSFRERNQFIEGFNSEVFDLLVIGGGITGAGILLDAQSRGLKAALIEMQDFAAGTSSRSTKLIHGGLRYLKNMEFKLVAEVGRERAIVFENGPHITKAERMLLPIVKNGSLSKFAAGLGVWVYDHLAGVKSEEHRKMLSAHQTLEEEPLLDKEKVTGGVLYYEYRTDDARLTIEIIKKAVELGGRAVNYMKANEFIYEEGKLVGVKAADLTSDREVTINAKVIVNATGPWVDTVITKDEPSKAGRLFLTKGVHFVVDNSKLPVKQSAYFDVGDGRMIFVIPREGKTYFGTTDTPYSGDFQNPEITQEDRSYLLKAVNQIFPTIHLKESDIISSWVGLRPLIREEGKSASEISRKDEIFVNQSGLISIAGGKLTGYRKMAQKIVDLVSKKLGKEFRIKSGKCKTEHLPLSGATAEGSKGFKSLVRRMSESGINSGLSSKDAEYIALHYGSNSSKLFSIAKQGKAEAERYQLPIRIYAQLLYGIQYELIISPSDFFIRRTGFLYFYPAEVKYYKDQVIQFLKDKLNWDSTLEQNFKMDLEKQMSISFGNFM
jgi:glycerol-3-phosphate dehydrogenase